MASELFTEFLYFLTCIVWEKAVHCVLDSEKVAGKFRLTRGRVKRVKAGSLCIWRNNRICVKNHI